MVRYRHRRRRTGDVSFFTYLGDDCRPLGPQAHGPPCPVRRSGGSGSFYTGPECLFVVICRVLEGLFTGTVAAASALIASQTPRDKLSYSMGILMSAVFGGQTLGPLIGGFVADNFGFKVAFIIVPVCCRWAG